MNIDFGEVREYFSDRGFGFIRGLLLGSSSEIFFHIKAIKKSDPQLAERLVGDHISKENIHFWFESEMTPKGTQVRAVLLPRQIGLIANADHTRLVERIEFYWRNLERQKPSWLDVVTSDLVGRDRADELIQERGRLEAQEQKRLEQEHEELQAKALIEQEQRQNQRAAAKAQEQIEENEFQNLVNEISALGFTHSSQVSRYIVSNRLGYKYKNISGILQMELDGTTWGFKGGFPPNIYARLCDNLGLSNNGTRARALAFESFGDIERRSRNR